MERSPSIVAAFRGDATTSLPRACPCLRQRTGTFTRSAIIALALASTAPTLAQSIAPRAHGLGAETVNDDQTTFVVAGSLPDTTTRVGFHVAGNRTPRTIGAGFSFGAFPSGKPVQAAIRTPLGDVERFGPVVRATPASGFHSPSLIDLVDIQRSAMNQRFLATIVKCIDSS